MRGNIMRRTATGMMILVLGLVGLGCDREGRPVQEFGLEKLSIGTSSEGDVQIAMGKPETTWEDEDGTRILEYPKGPEGARTWIFTINSKGTLSGYHQALSPENLARIKPGMSRDSIRRLLGKPRTIVHFNRLKEEVWDYRYLNNEERLLFNVHFDQATGKVTRTSSTDPRN